MKQRTFIVNIEENLEEFLDSKDIKQNVQESKSVLVQIFVNIKTKEAIDNVKNIIKAIEEKIPKAIIVGMSNYSRIANGEIIKDDTVVSITFFDTTELKVFSLDLINQNETVIDLGIKIRNSYNNISALLVLTNILKNVKHNKLIEELCENMENIHVFGGAASVNDLNYESGEDIIINGQNILKQGIIVVVFSGEDLQVEKYAYIGWEPLSKEMTVTKVEDGMWVKEIEGKSPISIYKRYLGMKSKEDSLITAIQFPILIERNGQIIPRVFGAYNEDGSVYTYGNFEEGEKVKIGYGAPEYIIRKSSTIQKKISEFNPESIFIYSCNMRNIFLGENEILEIKPFQNIAPTVGGYTFGELYGMGKDTVWENIAMVVVGMREGKPKNNINIDENKKESEKIIETNLSKNTLIPRLVHFINAVVGDYKEAQEQLELLSNTDKLTKVNNRLKLDKVLKEEMTKVKNDEYNVSIVLLDIDHFKLVNDTYGHHIGDIVLIEIANMLKTNIRRNDIVGRWGGEEFLIILKNIKLENAIHVAERIRKIINNYKFTTAGKVSASFGVTTITKLDDEITVLNRVDKALYEAKSSGRNKVIGLK